MDAVTGGEAETEASGWPRRLLLWGLPLAVVAIAVYLYGSAGRYVTTDNAYLQQDRVDVAPQLSGSVSEVYVAENGRVAAGQSVLKLDDRQFRIALAAAESHLSSARAELAAVQASYREKTAEIGVARRAAEFADRELARQRELATRRLNSTAQLDAAERSAELAHGAAGVLTLQLAETAARLGGSPLLPAEHYGSVRSVAAELERVRLDLERTTIRAPQAGIASHLPKVGNRIDVGRAAFAIVVDQRLWIEANFKETDLEWVRPGQPVEVGIDTYSRHRWRGRVESISQATGAEFALLPAQNASGNWVKVVQRIAVRIALERRPDDPPLRDGMSAGVTIDTGPHSRFSRWFGRGPVTGSP